MTWTVVLATAPVDKLSSQHKVTDSLLPAMVFGVASFTICMFAAPYVIMLLRRLRAGKLIRGDGPESHLVKAGTPAMGGILFSGTTIFLTVAFNIMRGHYQQLLTLGALLSCSVLGMVDDLLSTFRVGKAGLRARFKFAWTVVIAVIIVAVLHIPRLLAHPNDVWVPTQGYVDFVGRTGRWPSSPSPPRRMPSTSPTDWTAWPPAPARSGSPPSAPSHC